MKIVMPLNQFLIMDVYVTVTDFNTKGEYQ